MIKGGLVTWAEKVGWWKTLHAKGWAAPGFPVEHGGTGWDIVQQSIYFSVLAEEGAPMSNIWAQKMIGPVLIAFGSEKQKKLIPPLLSVEDFWCQGFSEPGAGSDLASLKTTAEDGVTTGWSTARSCGPPMPITLIRFFCWYAPTPRLSHRKVSACCWQIWIRREYR